VARSRARAGCAVSDAYARRSGKKRRFTVYLDEHVDPVIKEIFTAVGFRCIRISESKYRGQDERNYIGKLRSESAVFVTGDQEFVEDVDERKIRHGGIIWIPASLPRDEKQTLAAIMAGYMKGLDLRLMKDIVMYVAHDGLRLHSGDKDELAYSFPQINRDLEEFWRSTSSIVIEPQAMDDDSGGISKRVREDSNL